MTNARGHRSCSTLLQNEAEQLGASQLYWLQDWLDYDQKITGHFYDPGRNKLAGASLPSLMSLRARVPCRANEREVLLVDPEADLSFQIFVVRRTSLLYVG